MTRPRHLRQRLAQFAGEIPALIEPAHERSPLWPGIVYQARRKCGKPGCRCMRGQPHMPSSSRNSTANTAGDPTSGDA